MKRVLKKIDSGIYYLVDEIGHDGAPPSVSGDLSGVSGNLTGVSGDLDDAEITDQDRKNGIDINDLIKD